MTYPCAEAECAQDADSVTSVPVNFYSPVPLNHGSVRIPLCAMHHSAGEHLIRAHNLGVAERQREDGERARMNCRAAYDHDLRLDVAEELDAREKERALAAYLLKRYGGGPG